jgi:hypothetical protein
MSEAVHPVWRRHPGLVWSNRNADDTVRLRAALIRPRFRLLLDLALVFGLERLRQEWEVLSREESPEARRAAPVVERILNHIGEGFRRADSGN